MNLLISEEELVDLLTDQHILNCLRYDGVDNWNWYMEGREQYLLDGGLTKKEIDEDFDFSELARREVRERFKSIK